MNFRTCTPSSLSLFPLIYGFEVASQLKLNVQIHPATGLTRWGLLILGVVSDPSQSRYDMHFLSSSSLYQIRPLVINIRKGNIFFF